MTSPRASMSLRRRATLGFTLLGLVLSLLFAIVCNQIAEDYEHILASEILRGQAEDYSRRLAAGHRTPLPQSRRLSGYLSSSPNLPRGYAALPPGIHEDPRKDDIHIGVFDTRAGRLLFVVDLSDIEELETLLNWFLASMVIVGTALAGWLGRLLAGAVIAPVVQLATAVDKLSIQPTATALATTVSRDELGHLAAAIDGYQARLLEADVREQAFFADASHELRTPIAVVQGAAEILLEDAGPDSSARRWLLRMDRGVQELTDLLDVLLGLARRRSTELDDVELAALLSEACAGLRGNRPDLRIEIDCEGRLRLPRRESLLLLRSLVRHASANDAPGSLRLSYCPPCIEIAFVSGSDPAPALGLRRAARADGGRALSLIERLAEHIGWHIETSDSGGLRVRLPDSAFSRSAP